MTKGYVRKATSADVEIICKDLRPADLAEIKAITCEGPKSALLEGLRNGHAEVACLGNGYPAAIYGVVPSGTPKFGLVWMVATNSFHLLHMQFLRECRSHLNRISKPYRAVFNFTDARNTIHHRWLKWCDFTIIRRHEQFGKERRPFYEFTKITER